MGDTIPMYYSLLLTYEFSRDASLSLFLVFAYSLFFCKVADHTYWSSDLLSVALCSLSFVVC